MELFELFANKAEKKAILSSSDVMLGFEFELLIPRPASFYDASGNLKDARDDQRLVRKHLAEIITEKFGVKVIVLDTYSGAGADDPKPKRLDAWYIEPDGSIEQMNRHIPSEVVTQPYPLEEGLSVLSKFFSLMKEQNLKTVKSTGLHVNVSINGKTMTDVDFLKLAMFFDEAHMLASFGRRNNTYALDIKERFVGLLGNYSLETILGNKVTLSKITAALKKFSGEVQREMGRQSSFNVRSNGVAEIRGFGNEGYENQYASIQRQILNFIQAYKIATDPDAMNKEYVKKFIAMYDGKFLSAPDKKYKGILEKWFPSIYREILSNSIAFSDFTFVLGAKLNKKPKIAISNLVMMIGNTLNDEEEFTAAVQNDVERFMIQYLGMGRADIQDFYRRFEKDFFTLEQ